MHLRIIYLSIIFMMTSSSVLLSQYFEEIRHSQKIEGLSKATTFKLNKIEFNKLISQKSNELRISIPYRNNQDLNLILEAKKILSSDFRVYERTANGKKLFKWTEGEYYKGYIEGTPSSVATISIHEDEINGIIVLQDKRLSLGKLKGEERHVIFDANQAEEQPKQSCAVLPSERPEPIEYALTKNNTTCSEAVKIYFECDYQMYQNHNNNTAQVTNYVNSLFNQVSTLFDNEDITLQISQIDVWTVNDNYANGTGGLSDFANSNNSSGFNGDLAHLLTNDTGANGGVAYVDQLCGNNPYAYSDIINTSSNYPTYSWDVQVVTHELGHNFGSYHTHDCVWGPNNDEQIDDCGNVALGYGGPCYDSHNPIIPNAGGTIMSYCHANSVGIDFTQGFGDQPGDLIRAKYSACFCDNSTCQEAVAINTDGIYFAQPSAGNGATSHNATHADWFSFTPSSNGLLTLRSCNEGVDTRVWIRSGACNSLVYESLSDDDCTSSGSTNYASEIVDYPLVAGVSYFIEWDDRWSTASFYWEFEFNSTGGGLPPCDGTNLNVNGNILSTDYRAKLTLSSSGSLSSNATSFFKAGDEIELKPGFQSNIGGDLTVEIEDCEN